MIAKDGQPAEAEGQSNYEAAVLDFLDKEMANVEPKRAEKKQSEELDALVTDLLNQVIAESDQPQASADATGTPEDINALLAEFIPQSETVAAAEGRSEPAKPQPDVSAIQTGGISAGDDISVRDASQSIISELPAEPMPEAKTSPASFAAMFASRDIRKIKTPIIGAAAVCALAVIGIVVYYFSGSSGKTQAPIAVQTAAPAAVAPAAASQPAQVSSQPVAKTSASGTVLPIAGKKVEPAGTKNPVPEAESQKLPTSQAMTRAAAPVGNAANPAPPKEEIPHEAQVVQSQPAVMPQAVPENAEPPAVNENPVLASPVLDSKPVPQSPVIIAGALNTSPAPQPPAPTPVPAPVVARNLVPAIVISQVSPKYPDIAMRTRSSGTVVLQLDVDKQGKVVKATPISGSEVFYGEAIKAAMQWRYRPASINGNDISSQVKVTFNFNLKK